MSPEDFILNTDYLSIATKSRFTTIVELDQVQINADESVTTVIDVIVPNGSKALSRFSMSLDNYSYKIGSTCVFYPNANLGLTITAYHAAPTVLRIVLMRQDLSGVGQTAPRQNVWIKETLITAPDVL